MRFLTFTNWGSMEICLNMVESLKNDATVNPEEVIIECVDDESYGILTNMNLPYEIGRFSESSPENYIDFSRQAGNDYPKLMKLKPLIIKKYYEKYGDIFYIDNDVVFFASIHKYLQVLNPNKTYFQNESFTESPDPIRLDKMFHTIKPSSSNEFLCCGLSIYFKNETSTKIIDYACTYDGVEGDDQLHVHKLIREDEFVRSNVILLDRDTFANGWWMYSSTRWRRQDCIAAHFNWLNGKKEKVQRMIEQDKWRPIAFPESVVVNGKYYRLPELPAINLPVKETKVPQETKESMEAKRPTPEEPSRQVSPAQRPLESQIRMPDEVLVSPQRNREVKNNFVMMENLAGIAEEFDIKCLCLKHPNILQCLQSAEMINVRRDKDGSGELPKEDKIQAETPCIFEQLKYFLVALRRGKKQYWPFFLSYLNDNLANFEKFASIRWMSSILDTFVDYGSPNESRNALLVVTWVVSEKNRLLINEESFLTPLPNRIEADKAAEHLTKIAPFTRLYKSRLMLSGPPNRYEWHLNDWTDYMRNYFMRMNRLLAETPIIERLYKALFVRMEKSKMSVLSQFNRLAESCKDVNELIQAPLDYVNIPKIPKIFCKEELCDIINLFGLKTGIELGVGTGKFSAMLLDRTCLENLHGADRWNEKNGRAEMDYVIKRFREQRARYTIHQNSLENCSKFFDDGFFDFVYLTPNATYTEKENLNLLQLWLPKLKTGGVFAGGGYSSVDFSEVKKAVDDFTKSIGRLFYITTSDGTPSWYFVK